MLKHKNTGLILSTLMLSVAAVAFNYFMDSSIESVTTDKLDSVQHFKDSSDDTHNIAKAFHSKQSDLQVQAKGKVIAVLKDDNEGSRHQKFILELNNGQTVLVAHNIDLAPRIEGIEKGDIIEFYGEYEYSDKGGVIHWTHHDPAEQHLDGWLKHNGKTYQ